MLQLYVLPPGCTWIHGCPDLKNCISHLEQLTHPTTFSSSRSPSLKSQKSTVPPIRRRRSVRVQSEVFQPVLELVSTCSYSRTLIFFVTSTADWWSLSHSPVLAFTDISFSSCVTTWASWSVGKSWIRAQSVDEAIWNTIHPTWESAKPRGFQSSSCLSYPPFQSHGTWQISLLIFIKTSSSQGFSSERLSVI